MNQRNSRVAVRAGLIAGLATLVTLTGCVTNGSYHRRGYRAGPVVQIHGSVGFTDDYDYYPRYETYYSRSRHEFVYREGRTWVRRPQPRGISMDLFLAAPSVRMEFRDSPERHHRQVVKTYPKRWTPPGAGHDARSDRNGKKSHHRRGERGERNHDDRRSDDRRN